MLLMKTIAAALFATPAIGIGLLDGPAAGADRMFVATNLPVPEEKDPRRHFDGEWKFISVKQKGVEVPFAQIKDLRFRFWKGKLEVRNPGGFSFGFDSCELKVDPTADPKEIDLTILDDGPDKGRTLRGIYQVRNGVLKIALRLPGQNQFGRPRGYTTVSGTLTTIDLEPVDDPN